MYQFYYADRNKKWKHGKFEKDIKDIFMITSVRPTMWEEHCLECSAPLCYKSCLHYEPRIDGRCKRFKNSYYTFKEPKACCGQGVHVEFRKWANMMTIIFPAMLSQEGYLKLHHKNQKLGVNLGRVAKSVLPLKLRWEVIRTFEFLRRRKLRKIVGSTNIPDAFVFHGYSYAECFYNLVVEIYDDHKSVFKTALMIQPGENLIVLDKSKLDTACWTDNFLVKVYPENDLEVEIDILWCDFVKGDFVYSDKPSKNVKCVVWDLDNTIWNGILIETNDLDSLKLNDGVLETIQQLDARGIIQSIASKNDYTAAVEVLQRLGIADYFLYPQIHWNAKSNSVEQIAKELNIGIDSLALIDDTKFEREQVNSVWPQVRTYDVLELHGLLNRPEFDVLITDESKMRREMYRAEEKRNQMKNFLKADITEFIRQCNIRIEIFEPKTKEERVRCYELVVRTNQLNMSGIKYTNEEFVKILQKKEYKNFAFSCLDNYGKYGIVGFGQYKVNDKILMFSEFAMSCRVAGKYVESALFYTLLKKEECEKGYFTVQKTRKNSLLRNTLEEIGFVSEQDSDKMVRYVFTVDLKNPCLVQSKEREN